MLSNKPMAITLVAELVNGQPSGGKTLAQSLFNQIGDRVDVSQQ